MQTKPVLEPKTPGTFLKIFRFVEGAIVLFSILIFIFLEGFIKFILNLIDLNQYGIPQKIFMFETKTVVQYFLYFLFWVYVLSIMIRFFKRYKQKRQYFLQNSKIADAEILQVEQGMNQHAAKLKLQVKPNVGAEFETILNMQYTVAYIPKVGDTIKIRYNPKNHKEIELASDSNSLLPTSRGSYD